MSLDLGGFSPSQMAFARRAWAERAMTEYRSVQIMLRFGSELAAAGAEPSELAWASELIEDEIAHAELCREVCVALGTSPQRPEPPELREPSSFLALPAAQRALVTALTMLLIDETISVALITSLQQRCTQPWFRVRLDRLVGDEEGHAQRGVDFVTRGLARVRDVAASGWTSMTQKALEPRLSEQRAIVAALPAEKRVVEAWPEPELRQLGLMGRELQAIVYVAAYERQLAPKLRALRLIASP